MLKNSKTGDHLGNNLIIFSFFLNHVLIIVLNICCHVHIFVNIGIASKIPREATVQEQFYILTCTDAVHVEQQTERHPCKSHNIYTCVNKIPLANSVKYFLKFKNTKKELWGLLRIVIGLKVVTTDTTMLLKNSEFSMHLPHICNYYS